MEEALAVVVGLGVVAASPFVPGLRPLAKKFIATGLVVGSSVTTAAAVAGEHWKDLLAEARAERDAANEHNTTEQPSELITIPKA